MSSSPATGRGGSGVRRLRQGEAVSATGRNRGKRLGPCNGSQYVSGTRSPRHRQPEPLRLVADTQSHATWSEPAQPSTPITQATDPRWVLAVRTAEQLEGTLLSPEKRQRLIRTGRVMGLTAFDCNLVIAIVQDQARRGHAPAYCPAAAEDALAMVPPAARESIFGRVVRRPALLITVLVMTVLTVEFVLLRWLL